MLHKVGGTNIIFKHHLIYEKKIFWKYPNFLPIPSFQYLINYKVCQSSFFKIQETTRKSSPH